MKDVVEDFYIEDDDNGKFNMCDSFDLIKRCQYHCEKCKRYTHLRRVKKGRFGPFLYKCTVCEIEVEGDFINCVHCDKEANDLLWEENLPPGTKKPKKKKPPSEDVVMAEAEAEEAKSENEELKKQIEEKS